MKKLRARKSDLALSEKADTEKARHGEIPLPQKADSGKTEIMK
jgi:hypothetical protein